MKNEVRNLMNSGKWIDEDGKMLTIVPFLSHIYIDEICKELREKYDFYKKPKHVPGLGKTEYETAANSLIDFYYFLRKPFGIESSQLEKVGEYFNLNCLFGRSWDYEALFSMNLMRKKKVAGIEVLFPKEELIKFSFPKTKS